MGRRVCVRYGNILYKREFTSSGKKLQFRTMYLHTIYIIPIKSVYSKNILLPRRFIQWDNMFVIVIFDRLEVCIDTGNNNS